VVALSEHCISEALYFENSLFRIKQLIMLFSAQKVLYWFRVTKSKLTIRCTTASVECCLSKSLLHYDVKSSEQLKLNRSSPQWFCKYSRYTVFIRLSSLIDNPPQRQLFSWLSDSIYKCTYVWINSSHCSMGDICWVFGKLSIFSAPCS